MSPRPDLTILIYQSLKGVADNFDFGPNKTFSGLSFGSSIASTGHGGKPLVRSKNQDFVLGRKLFLRTSFDPDFAEAETIESRIGYVCCECKTNLDKTMFQEAVATSRNLKEAVPSALYFVLCEFLDMTPVSLTPTQIDDVLIVRKAKRLGSNIRQEYTSAIQRRAQRAEFARFVTESRFYPDVFERMIRKIQTVIDDTDPPLEKVLRDGHF